jgi:hypothetical protein
LETLLIVLSLDLVRGVVLTFLQSLPVPFFGMAASAFLSSYAYLAIGCTLGFAIRKKAPEMGLE